MMTEEAAGFVWVTCPAWVRWCRTRWWRSNRHAHNAPWKGYA